MRAALIRAINDVLDREINKDLGSGNDSQHAEQLCSAQLYSTSEMHVAQNKFELTQGRSQRQVVGGANAPLDF